MFDSQLATGSSSLDCQSQYTNTTGCITRTDVGFPGWSGGQLGKGWWDWKFVVSMELLYSHSFFLSNAVHNFSFLGGCKYVMKDGDE